MFTHGADNSQQCYGSLCQLTFDREWLQVRLEWYMDEAAVSKRSQRGELLRQHLTQRTGVVCDPYFELIYNSRCHDGHPPPPPPAFRTFNIPRAGPCVTHHSRYSICRVRQWFTSLTYNTGQAEHHKKCRFGGLVLIQWKWCDSSGREPTSHITVIHQGEVMSWKKWKKIPA